MKILSLNVRGLEGKTKHLCLRKLFLSLGPDMILLQETMCSTYPALHAFSKLLPSWEFCDSDASGLSGGLLTAWNPMHVKFWAFETCVGILVHAAFWGLPIPLAILNVYGPYRDRELFWDKAHNGGILSIPNLILGGDLNLVFNSSEI